MTDDYPTRHNARLRVEEHLRQRQSQAHAARRARARALGSLWITLMLASVLCASWGAGDGIGVRLVPRYVTERMAERCDARTATPSCAPTAAATPEQTLTIATSTNAPSVDGHVASMNRIAPSYLLRRRSEPCDAATAPEWASSFTSPMGESYAPRARGAMGVASALLTDGQTASRLAPMILRLATVPSERLYDLAWSIARWSRNYGVRPEIVVGVLFIESRFDPAARNGVYLGLGQLGPSVRRAYHVTAPFDVAQNVRGTCANLGDLIRLYGECDGVAAHNGGAGGRNSKACQGYARLVLAIANGDAP